MRGLSISAMLRLFRFLFVVGPLDVLVSLCQTNAFSLAKVGLAFHSRDSCECTTKIRGLVRRQMQSITTRRVLVFQFSNLKRKWCVLVSGRAMEQVEGSVRDVDLRSSLFMDSGGLLQAGKSV